MAIIQAGKQFTAADIKMTAGNLASMMTDHVQSGTDFATQLQTMPDGDLVTLGLTPEEVAAIKGFYVSELPAVRTALQNSFFLRSLIGMGV